MTYEFVVLERASGIATIVLNRPEVLNALNRQMYSELDEAITVCEADASVSVIIVSGGLVWEGKFDMESANTSRLASSKGITLYCTCCGGP